MVRKVSAALAAGCSIIVKGPEETPGDAAPRWSAPSPTPACPPGVINLVYGVPSEISEYLIPHPVIRKITFTGSTPVGKQLAALAGQHMKRVTMELGGHAPAIVFDDADVEQAVKLLAGASSATPARSASRRRASWCRKASTTSSSRRFAEASEATQGRRRPRRRHHAWARWPTRAASSAMESFVDDAVARAPSSRPAASASAQGLLLRADRAADVPLDAEVMNDEPFGPLAPITPFKDFDEVMAEANRLPFGLAAYAYTRSLEDRQRGRRGVESGMVSINHLGLALPEVPFGGVKDSGYGSEGGTEAIEAYLNTKFVTQVGV